MRSIYTFTSVTNELTIWALKYAFHTLNLGQPPPGEEGLTIILVKASLPPELSRSEKEKKGKGGKKARKPRRNGEKKRWCCGGWG